MVAVRFSGSLQETFITRLLELFNVLVSGCSGDTKGLTKVLYRMLLRLPKSDKFDFFFHRCCLYPGHVFRELFEKLCLKSVSDVSLTL